MQNMSHRSKITEIVIKTLLLHLRSLKCVLSGLSFLSLRKAFLLGNTHHKQQQAKGRMLARALVNWRSISDSACLRVPFPRAFSLCNRWKMCICQRQPVLININGCVLRVGDMIHRKADVTFENDTPHGAKSTGNTCPP